ncbi:DUF3575 domain-containing protein [Millionella massiliensis]|uniref:DUF3575 domain-containing protein n=1 Tax=Millionella massiliensis TaxID=1871023 RepID=UPI0008DAEAE1|nr:DUF3575 domain-containing protein [Millionella massiliensis]
MSRKIVILALFALVGTVGRTLAQSTSLKWNALYWVVGVPNMSVETRLGEKFTFNADAVYSPWKSVKGRPLQGLQLIPEVRFYPKEAMKGFYVGGFVSYDSYKVSKWDHPKNEVQHGIGMCLGATVGWQIDIARRWGMDFYAGGGWHLGWYYGVNTQTGQRYANWNRSGEWIPYKVGVAFVYRLGMGRQ